MIIVGIEPRAFYFEAEGSTNSATKVAPSPPPSGTSGLIKISKEAVEKKIMVTVGIEPGTFHFQRNCSTNSATMLAIISQANRTSPVF